MRPINALLISLTLTGLLSVNPTAMAQPPLVVATWGGAYQAVLEEILFSPFTAETGIPVETRPYSGGLEILEAERVPDLIDMTMNDAMAACEQGQITRLEFDDLPDGADGTPADQDFIAGALGECALTHSLYATVVAYDTRAFRGFRPDRIEDLFNLEDFPGKRALQDVPDANIEWALRSYDVPSESLYELISTPRGMALVFERLSKLKPHILWWTEGSEPVELLESGQVVMASGYNGRFFAAMVEGSPIQILWDSQIQEYQTWVIPASARNPSAARAFMRFATTTERLAAVAERIAYGPARQSASALMHQHPDGFDIRPHIPTHPYNNQTAIAKDVAWYSRVRAHLQEHFEKWRDE
ncbi:extracellular solute-binding protein [Vreelandella aquamarina]